jgi:hypothetical protein
MEVTARIANGSQRTSILLPKHRTVCAASFKGISSALIVAFLAIRALQVGYLVGQNPAIP